MSKQQRNEKVKEIANEIKDKSLVFIDYQGINVQDFTELRDELRSSDAQVKVFKNTLTLRALDSLSLKPFQEDLLTQMTATAIVEPDAFMAASKSIFKVEKQKKVKIKGGFFDGGFLDSEWVRKYATIPGRDELYGILVATLQQVVGNVVFVLEEIKKKKEESQGH